MLACLATPREAELALCLIPPDGNQRVCCAFGRSADLKLELAQSGAPTTTTGFPLGFDKLCLPDRIEVPVNPVLPLLRARGRMARAVKDLVRRKLLPRHVNNLSGPWVPTRRSSAPRRP